MNTGLKRDFITETNPNIEFKYYLSNNEILVIDYEGQRFISQKDIQVAAGYSRSLNIDRIPKKEGGYYIFSDQQNKQPRFMVSDSYALEWLEQRLNKRLVKKVYCFIINKILEDSNTIKDFKPEQQRIYVKSETSSLEKKIEEQGKKLEIYSKELQEIKENLEDFKKDNSFLFRQLERIEREIIKLVKSRKASSINFGKLLQSRKKEEAKKIKR